MRHENFRKLTASMIAIAVSAFFAGFCTADEVSGTVAMPVHVAEPVKANTILNKIFGKTMKTVSHKGAGGFSKLSQKERSADKAAPETEEPKLFDPKSQESPIRTARLFKIQFNPLVAEPVN